MKNILKAIFKSGLLLSMISVLVLVSCSNDADESDDEIMLTDDEVGEEEEDEMNDDEMDEEEEDEDPDDDSNTGNTAADIIGSGWKLNGYSGTLNIGSSNNGLNYEDDASTAESHFFFEKDGYAAFRSHPGNPTSGGSSNSRSELREIINGGNGYWDGTTSSERSMKWRFIVENLPPSGKVAFGQIHERNDPYDDVIRVQVQGDGGQSSGNVDLRILGYVTENIEGQGRTIDFDMNLGAEYYFELTMSGSVVTLYNLDDGGDRVETLFTSVNIGDADENYFKAGCYLQSTSSSHDPSVYGQVLIKDLLVNPDD